MGSTISRAVPSAARAVPTATRKSTTPPPTAKQVLNVPPSTSAPPSPPDLPPDFGRHRQTPQEWASTLQAISGAISSTPWDVEDHPPQPPGAKSDDASEGRHPAERSAALRSRLPSRPKLIARKSKEAVAKQQSSSSATGTDAELLFADPGLTGNQSVPGRLTQREVLALFQLRRENTNEWGIEALSEKFGLRQEDVKELLRFSRTYLAKEDIHGVLRGYYKPDTEPPVSRFERD